MLRLLLLCAFVTAGLSLSAQETASTKKSCAATCAKKVASTSCQAKTTSVAVAESTTLAPERANAVAEEATAPAVKPALFKLTSLTEKPANCQPTKDCNPNNCKPSACQPGAAKTTAVKTTSLAVKQE